MASCILSLRIFIVVSLKFSFATAILSSEFPSWACLAQVPHVYYSSNVGKSHFNKGTKNLESPVHGGWEMGVGCYRPVGLTIEKSVN